MQVEMADAEGLRASLKEISPMVAKNTEGLRKNGTAGGLATFEALGSLPLQNWKFQGRWEQGAAKIAGPAMTEKILTGNYFCERCVIGCGRRVKVDKGPFAPVEGAGPEYESVAMLGSLCLVDDIEAIAKANEICNRYGMDTISAGAAIAFAMEAFEKGIITKKDTGELELLWGRGDVMVKMAEKIGKREGLGQLLGEGVRIAAEKLGKNAVEFSIHVKGQEMPAHDPRCFNAGAVGYATINRGACHLGFSHVFERVLSMPEIGVDQPLPRLEVKGKGELAAKTQNIMGLFDSLKVCKFSMFGGLKMTPILAWYNMVTGNSVTMDEFLKTGERIFNLKRMYNVRCGISRKDDVLPSRFLTLKHEGEGLNPNLPPLGELLYDYYKFRGWNEEGIPAPEKLKELGL
jgi:aldehyde:ferredoxin oxidoreductase